MSKWSLTTKLKTVFIIVLAVILANATVSYSNTAKLIKNQQYVSNSHEIIIQLEKTLSSFGDAQIKAGNFLIFSDIENLEGYLKANQQTKTNIKALKQLTADNRQKLQQIIILEQQINQRLKAIESEISLGINRDLSVVKQLISSPENKQAINKIQQKIQTLETEETKLLHKRIYQLQISSQNAMTTFSIAAFGDIAFVLLLYHLLKRYITGRKQTELALRQSENRLRAMIDAEPECIKLIDIDGTLLEINAAGVTMMEVDSADVLIGKSVYPGIASEYRQEYMALHENVCQGKKGKLQFEIIGFKGARRWVETHAVPLRNEAKGTFWHLAVTRDITKRKQQEEKIREQAALLDVATDAILVKDIQNQILYWNKSAQRLYGWTTEEALQKNASVLLYKETSGLIQDAFLTVLSKGEWQGELNQITKDGKEIITESRWTLVKDENQQPKSILTVNTEITQKKQLEAQLLRSQRLESIGTLAGGIAHDLNNVLAPILMSVQLLQMKLKDEQHQQILKTLEANVKRGANLVKQVLSFARGIEGKRTIVNIRQLIYEIEQIIIETFPKSIICQINIPDNLWHVWGDTTQLHQVLMNLVVNARDAILDSGRLTISAENLVIDEHYAQMNIDAQVGSYITITVVDTGIGMSPKIQERIFEPFFTTKDVGKGTGLGLSTVLGIIKNHNGFVNVCSEVSKGTQFQIYLPAYTNSEIFTPSLEIEPFNGSGELILVVDDEAPIREITRSSLEIYNYRVLTANDGVEALSIYAQHKQEICLVLLDMMMPTMDGLVTIRTLQKINPTVKIIAISGLISNQKMTEAAGLGVKAFLSKPCTAKELLQKINSVKNGC
ncbi:MAG: PAS domain S-box protein [Scytonematopsis contorta HA4267-MV1]|jgi:PAS domain S-box-containing protein|nr:PAS domain S-box protein [Scytonematopsis contorta HA4267-MV1]